MSSPPPSAGSPTGSSFPMPQKRPSLSSGPGGSAKQRKTSFASTASTHPLRQTSFPPQSALSPTVSPSRQGSFSPSVASSRGGGGGGGRKKGKRGARAASQATDAGGDGEAVSREEREYDEAQARAASADQSARNEEEENDESDGGDGDENILEAGGLSKEKNELKEREENMLLQFLKGDQNDRMVLFKRVRLKRETVRRIVNQTLSQSALPAVITSVNGFLKVFAGDLVETARQVQTERIAQRQIEGAQEARRVAALPAEEGQVHRISKLGTDTAFTDAADLSSEVLESARLHPNPLRVEQIDRGPIIPDDMREAYRRIKKNREGHSIGIPAMSMLGGPEAVAPRTSGKRLFR